MKNIQNLYSANFFALSVWLNIITLINYVFLNLDNRTDFVLTVAFASMFVIFGISLSIIIYILELIFCWHLKNRISNNIFYKFFFFTGLFIGFIWLLCILFSFIL